MIDHLSEIRKIAEEVCTRESCVLWDVELFGSGRNRTLRVTIEGQGRQVTVNDCENVSKGLNLLLDVQDLVPGGSYNLEVSSPGVERLLKNSRQYVLSVGQHVEVVLVDPHPDLTGDRHRTTGKLRAADEQGIELELENGQVLRVEFGQIRRGKIVFGIKKNKKR